MPTISFDSPAPEILCISRNWVDAQVVILGNVIGLSDASFHAGMS